MKKNKNKLVNLSLALATISILSVGSINSVFASERVVKVQIGSDKAYTNGVESTIDAIPYQDIKGNTMVPVRFISTALGIDNDNISYAWETKEVTIISGSETLKFKVGESTLTKYLSNGTSQVYTMQNGSVAELIDGRTFVPLRTLSEIFGVSVGWDQDTKTVTLIDETNSNSNTASNKVPITTTEATTQTTTAQATTNTTTTNNNNNNTTLLTSCALKAMEFELEVISLVNIERAKEGLAPLEKFDSAMDLARAKSQEMVDRNYFSHQDPDDGSYMFQQLQSYSSTLGENIASGQTTPEQVVDGWMNSPGHKANILNADYKYIGVGFVDDIWTQMFLGDLNKNNQNNQNIVATTQATTQATTNRVTTEATTQTTTKAPTTTTEATTQTTTEATTSSSSAREFEEEVVSIVNVERAKEGLAPFEIFEPAMDLARAKSQDMVDRNYFAHEDPVDGSYMCQQLQIYSWNVGENIASGQTTPAQVVDGWMNSPGHRANILSSDYKYIGVGFVNYKWTQMFLGDLR